MKYLKILAVALIVIGVTSCCACRTGKSMKKTLEGTEWQLVQIDGEAFSATNNSYTISMTIENKVMGRGDCNRITGSYSFSKEGSLAFGPLITTRMACPNPEMEHRFTSTLQSIASYEIDDDMLILFDKSGEKKMVLAERKAE